MTCFLTGWASEKNASLTGTLAGCGAIGWLRIAPPSFRLCLFGWRQEIYRMQICPIEHRSIDEHRLLITLNQEATANRPISQISSLFR
jgi:hypothetical protein